MEFKEGTFSVEQPPHNLQRDSQCRDGRRFESVVQVLAGA